MSEIIKYNHHGYEVSVEESLKDQHREFCLCWQGCKFFKPKERENNCSIANAVYDNCVKFHIVWECPKYEKSE